MQVQDMEKQTGHRTGTFYVWLRASLAEPESNTGKEWSAFTVE